MNKHLVFAIVVIVGLIIAIFAAHAHDAEHHEFNEWYQELKQPDNPNASCCGEADAYYADEMRYRDGKVYAVITDERDDKSLKRPHIPNGTEIEVPNNKLKWDRGNPTGHGVIFVSPHPYFFVFCYVQPGGV